MKHLLTLLAAISLCIFAWAETCVIEVGKTDAIPSAAPAKVVGVRVVSSVASGTCQVKSVSKVPVVEIQDVLTYSTNFTYTVIYTNALEQTFTNTTTYLPLPLGPTVTSYATNNVVAVSTNRVPTTTSTVVVTNLIGGSVTCSGGVGTDNPSNTFLIPGDPIFYEGTAAGRVLLVIER